MGTTADKLSYLEATKTAIRDAIIAKGVDVPEGTTFRQYAEKVGEIGSGCSKSVIDNTNYNEIRFVYAVSSDGSAIKIEKKREYEVLSPGIAYMEFGAAPPSISGDFELLEHGETTSGEQFFVIYFYGNISLMM